jgi:hypothetical protein
MNKDMNNEDEVTLALPDDAFPHWPTAEKTNLAVVFDWLCIVVVAAGMGYFTVWAVYS